MSHLETSPNSAAAVHGGTMRITVNGMTFSVSTEADLTAVLSQVAHGPVKADSLPPSGQNGRKTNGHAVRGMSWIPRWLFSSRQRMN